MSIKKPLVLQQAVNMAKVNLPSSKTPRYRRRDGNGVCVCVCVVCVCVYSGVQPCKAAQ